MIVAAAYHNVAIVLYNSQKYLQAIKVCSNAKVKPPSPSLF